MTLDDFLDDYVPRVLRPMGGWEVTPAGLIRRYEGLAPRCPLTAEAGLHPEIHFDCAKHLGISYREALNIAWAADFPRDVKEVAIRARLLVGLGLPVRDQS